LYCPEAVTESSIAAIKQPAHLTAFVSFMVLSRRVTANSAVIHRKPLQKLANELSWRHGLLAFDNARLADVVTEFNRYNDGKIVIASTAIDNLIVGGTFPITNVKAFTDLVQDVLGLHVEKRGNETVISR